MCRNYTTVGKTGNKSCRFVCSCKRELAARKRSRSTDPLPRNNGPFFFFLFFLETIEPPFPISGQADNSALSTLLPDEQRSRGSTTQPIHILYAIKPRDKCRSREPAERLAPNLRRNQLCSINRSVISKPRDSLRPLRF